MSDDRAVLSKLIRNLKNAGEEPLRPLIDAYLLERDHSPNRIRSYTVETTPRPRPGGRLSPSSIGGCQRQAALRFLGVRGRRKLDPDTELLFEDGVWRHHRWDYIFRDMEAVLGPERFRVLSIEEPVQIPELYIAGNLDTAIAIRKKKRVVDFKGINRYGADKVHRQGEPLVPHAKQLITYCRARGTPRGILLYENKDSQHTHIFHMEMDFSLWSQVQIWCEEVISMLEDEYLPPKHPECAGGNFLYNKCPYAHLCFGVKDDDAIQQLAYKRFRGVEHAWERGNRVANGSS